MGRRRLQAGGWCGEGLGVLQETGKSCRHVDVLPIPGNFHFLPYLFFLTFAMVKCLHFKTSYIQTQHVFSLYLVCAQF